MFVPLTSSQHPVEACLSRRPEKMRRLLCLVSCLVVISMLQSAFAFPSMANMDLMDKREVKRAIGEAKRLFDGINRDVKRAAHIVVPDPSDTAHQFQGRLACTSDMMVSRILILVHIAEPGPTDQRG